MPLIHRPATPADDPDLRRLLRENPFPGRIQVTMEREPNYFAANPIEGDFHQTAVVYDTETGRLVAMISRMLRDAYINGKVRRFGYMGQMRAEPGYRALPKATIRLGQLMEQFNSDGLSPLNLVSIIADNTPARHLFTGGLPHLPTLREYARYHTLALYTRRPRPRLPLPRALRLERGSPAHLPALLDCLERNGRRYQFAPRWTSSTLANPAHTPGLRLSDFWLALEGDTVRACAAFWDQSAVKQTIVRRYTGLMGQLRPLINAFSWMTGLPHLPAPNQPFRFGFVFALYADADDPQLLSVLLREAHNHAVSRGDSYLMLGLAERHPFFSVARRDYPHIDYPSQLYLGGWGEIDPQIARLDDRIAGVETCTL